MIETYVVKELRIVLHNLDEYNWDKKEYPEFTEQEHYENSEERFDVDDIVKVFEENGMTYIQVLNDDYQGGSHKVPVMEDYGEIRYILDHKKDYLK